MSDNNLPPHLQYLEHLDPKVLKALDGSSINQLSGLERQDLSEYHKYSVLLSDYNVELAKELAPEGVYPRLFGYRIRQIDLMDRDYVDKAARLVMAQVDSQLLLPFLPNPNYKDGGIPGLLNAQGSSLPKIVKVFEWIPLEVVPLPQALSSDLCIRIVVNVRIL